MLMLHNDPPDGTIVSPSGDVTIGLDGSVVFSGKGTDPENDSLTYHWNFGTSGIADVYIQNPGAVVFRRPGTFTVTLTVTDSENQSDPSPATVRVTVLDNRAPDGWIDNPASDILIRPGEQVQFAGSGTDPDGHTPLTFHWDFGSSAIPDSTAEDPGGVVFSDPGEYTVTLTVTDSKGLADPSPAQVTVKVNDYPESTIDSPVGGTVKSPGEQFCFEGSGADPDGHYPLTYQWDFGATGISLPGDAEDPGCQAIANADEYTITLTVTDSKGLADPTPATVTIRVNSAPDGQITSPTGNVTIDPGESVNFAGNASDSDGDTPLSYLWDFGDPAVGTSTALNPGQVTFPNSGRYQVTFTVTDFLGLADPTPSSLYVQVSGDVFPRIIDNLDQECVVPGDWGYTDSSSGCDFYESDYQFGSPGSLDKAVTWTFQPTEYGWYEVQIWWPSNDSCYSEGGSSWFSWEAPYTLSNNGIERDRYRLSHRDGGGEFSSVGTYYFAPGTVTLKLYNISSGRVRADAVRLAYSEDSSPRVEIVSPEDNGLETSTSITATALKANIPANWTVRFILDNDTGNPLNGTACGSGDGYVCLALNGLSRSEHTLRVEALDEADQVQASHEIDFGVGDYYVLVGDSISAGYGDDILSDNTSSDGRNSDGGWIPFMTPPRIQGGYGPILNDRLTAGPDNVLGTGDDVPHTVVDEGVGGSTSADGAARIASILALHPKATHILLFYGTNDAGQSIRRPKEEYQNYMQQIITAIKNAGKQVYLAKVPISLGEDPGGEQFSDPDNAEKNLLIKQYNDAVEQLVINNSIPVTPPDLYTQFLNNKDSWFSDNLHPNGNGYVGIAELWRDAIFSP